MPTYHGASTEPNANIPFQPECNPEPSAILSSSCVIIQNLVQIMSSSHETALYSKVPS